MKVHILGTGSHHCLELEMRLAAAVAGPGRTDRDVERVDDERIIRHPMPLAAIPGLLIDVRSVSQHDVPRIETLLGWLKAVPA